MKNKDRILDSALTLFNDQGTASVSTNHIAGAAGISPGNLYYHYRNKEAIIRDLFEHLFARWDTAFALPDDRVPTLADLGGLVATNFRIMHDYRIIYRELIALLRRDDALRERYSAVGQHGYAGCREIVAALMMQVLTPDRQFAADGRRLVLLWYGFAMTALLAMPLALGGRHQCRAAPASQPERDFALRCGEGVAFAQPVGQFARAR